MEFKVVTSTVYPSDILYEFMKKEPDREFTVTELCNALNVGEGVIRKALRTLSNRDMVISFAGGGYNSKTRLYKVL